MMPPIGSPLFASRGRLFLRWVQGFLFVTGILALSYVALVLLHARLYRQAADKVLAQQVDAQRQHHAMPQAAAREGDLLGRIEIPRLNLAVVILQGTTAQTLRLGAGHIDGTAFPGEPGNVGIAAHRDTFFRPLQNIRAGDEILLQTASGFSSYRVESLQIVDPSDVAVLAPSSAPTLTLVTCYPFHFIGSAPERFIVRARIIEANQSGHLISSPPHSAPMGIASGQPVPTATDPAPKQ